MNTTTIPLFTPDPISPPFHPYTASLDCLVKARGKAFLEQATSECRNFIEANIRIQEQEKKKHCGAAK